MLETLQRLVAAYGPLLVGACVLLEAAGLPLPGETALLVAAAAAGAGQLDITVVIAVAAGAAIVGDAAGYWLGRRGGRPLLERHGRWLHLDPARLTRLETFFTRYGPKAVFVGRFVGVLRTYTALFAGISRMPYGTFTLFNALGGLVWAAGFGAVGFLCGQHLATVVRIAETVGWALLLGGGLVGAMAVLWRWVRTHQALLQRWTQALLATPRIARARHTYRRQLAWGLARITPGGYLGLHLTVGVLTAAASLWLFGGILQDVLAQDPLVAVDQLVARTLQGWTTPLATAVFRSVSALGWVGVGVGSLAVAAACVWRRRWLPLAGWLLALGGGDAVNVALKLVLARPGPPAGVSFPSGHALVAVVAYGMLAYFAVLGLHTWRARTGAVCAASLIVLLIGLSRLVLGVHYLSDVLGGFAAGSVWLSTCLTGTELIRRGELGARWRGWWEGPAGPRAGGGAGA